VKISMNLSWSQSRLFLSSKYFSVHKSMKSSWGQFMWKPLWNLHEHQNNSFQTNSLYFWSNDCMKKSWAWNMWKSLWKCHDCTNNSLLFVHFISYLKIMWVVHEPEKCGNIYESAMISQTTIFLSIFHFSSYNCKTFSRSCNMWKSLWICHDLN
jgi:hypothetical protein